MSGYKKNRELLLHKPSLAEILSGARIELSMLINCESLIASESPLLHAAAVGFLLSGEGILGSAKLRTGVEQRAGLWVDAMPRSLVDKIEELAVHEVQRLIRETCDVDLAKLHAADVLVLRNQRRIMEAANRVLLRAKRNHVEKQLTAFDDLFPPVPSEP